MLKREILDSSHSKAKAAERQAEDEARKILHDAHFAAKKIEEAAHSEGLAFVESERKERLSAAKLEAQKAISEAREAAVNAALESVWQAFAARRKGQAYRSALLRLVDAGIAELGHGRPVVRCNAIDRKLLARRHYRLGSPIECEGGAIVETPDGRIRSDCTLEAIFASQKESVRKELYERLFGGQGEKIEIPLPGGRHAKKRKKNLR